MQLNPAPIQQSLIGSNGRVDTVWARWFSQVITYIGNIPSGGGDTPLTVISISANHTMLFSERVVLCDSSGGGFTVTLPSAADGNGLVYYIKKKSTDSNVVTISGTVDGTSVTIFGPYEAIRLVSNGVTWLSL